MNRRNTHRLAPAALALFLALGCTSSQAVVQVTDAPNTFGDFSNISYGNGGNVFELSPWLRINLLGSADAARTVALRNSALSFDFNVSGSGTGLLVLEYWITNTSTTERFDGIRFMLSANPDGDGAAFADRVQESWAAVGGNDAEPARRQVMAFSFVDNPASEFRLNANLIDAAPAGDCAAAVGCDAVVALQWNTPDLLPQTRLVMRIGLADDGSSLSGRFLQVEAVNSANTVLTLSGTAEIVPVPEPGTWALLAAGLAVMAWRRRALG